MGKNISSAVKMTSDAVFKHTEKNSFSARQKLAIFICLFISAAILFTVFIYDRHSPDKTVAEEKVDVDEDFPDPEPEPEVHEHDHENDDHGDDEDYWMEEDDLLDELAGY